MKVHYLPEFACALLNHHQGIYPLRTLAAELTRLGIEIYSPHVNSSKYHSHISEMSPPDTLPNGQAKHPPFLKGGRGDFEGQQVVQVGLDKIKGLTARTAERILQNRSANGLFTSLRNFLGRIHPTRIELAALVLSGACDGLHPLLPEWYPFVHEVALEILKKGGTMDAIEGLRLEIRDQIPHARRAMASQPSILVGQADQALGQRSTDLYSSLVRVRNELRYLEMHLSAHPVTLLRREAERYGCIPVRTATAARSGSRVRLLAIMAAMRRVPTRSGIMQFLTLEDETGLLEAAVLPPAYRALGDRVTTPGPFLVEGTLKRQQGATHLEVFKLSPFHQRGQP